MKDCWRRLMMSRHCLQHPCFMHCPRDIAALLQCYKHQSMILSHEADTTTCNYKCTSPSLPTPRGDLMAAPHSEPSGRRATTWHTVALWKLHASALNMVLCLRTLQGTKFASQKCSPKIPRSSPQALVQRHGLELQLPLRSQLAFCECVPLWRRGNHKSSCVT